MDNDKFPQLRAYLRTMRPLQQEEFARASGTTIGYLRKVLCKHCAMDVALVSRIVSNSDGALRAGDLRPDVNWDSLFRFHNLKRLKPAAAPALHKADPKPKHPSAPLIKSRLKKPAKVA